MDKKENKGGILTNEEIEQDLKLKGTAEEGGGYHGMQDTGDQSIRNMNQEHAEKESKDVEEEE